GSQDSSPAASQRGSEIDSKDEKSSEVASIGSRKRDHAECDKELYYVPSLRKYHNRGKDVDKYLKHYQQGTLTVLVIFETQNMRLRNQKSSKMKMHAGRSPSELPLVPQEMDHYQRVYVCTHGWKERVMSKGHIPRHNLKGAGCPMCFRVQFVQRSDVSGVSKLTKLSTDTIILSLKKCTAYILPSVKFRRIRRS
ncbi:hypothetical protein JG687_00015830, partial [Phytophthora cactorum]